MNRDTDQDDIDALVRAASRAPQGTEARLRASMARRLREPPATRPRWMGAGIALAGFSLLLVATPILIAGRGSGADAIVLGLALGDTSALGLPDLGEIR